MQRLERNIDKLFLKLDILNKKQTFKVALEAYRGVSASDK